MVAHPSTSMWSAATELDCFVNQLTKHFPVLWNQPFLDCLSKPELAGCPGRPDTWQPTAAVQQSSKYSISLIAYT